MIKNIYLNEVRAHVELYRRHGREDMLLIWDVTSDEVRDATTVALRAYSNRDDADVVIQCAGVNSIGDRLPARRIFMPTAASLAQIKAKFRKKELING